MVLNDPFQQQRLNEFPEQLIVNEYQAGQGISAHVDCEPCFKDTIVTVSLGSTYEMDFISLESGDVCSTLLKPGSALVLRGAGRYQWMHRIKARKSDRGVPRGRRVSLTYRNVILDS
ncbi:MAG: alpha-ketoglutarate-dependent dioxygenase AlkB [Gammaproteobacteria bacterium]